jgi:hypothetical protein
MLMEKTLARTENIINNELNLLKDDAGHGCNTI